MSSEGHLVICLNCYLVYRPDPRIHKNPHEYCPRCGFRIADGDRLWKGQ